VTMLATFYETIKIAVQKDEHGTQEIAIGGN